ncbi:hypothetical protein AB0A60_19355 [Streptomyces sp. NPDC046275]|uniref:hypothetical protein n=1 Tax=Streptomyces sp. NPDC046275 TaxID=3157201 RepID=UPI0034045F27
MPPASERSQVALQSMRGRLVHPSRRVTRLEACSAPAPEQPHGSQASDDPLGSLLDAVLDALNAFNDALESINGELTSFAARLTRLENTTQVQGLTRPPRLLRAPSAAPTVRAARGRLMRKAVSHA